MKRTRVRQLLHPMGRETIDPKPHTSTPGVIAHTYLSVLRGMRIERSNQVWAGDSTPIRLARGFMYLMAVIDRCSRYVLAREVSITLETGFCLDALDRALESARSDILQTDQEVQCTSHEFTGRLKAAALRINWDRRGQALDNMFVERLWRCVKDEEVSSKDSQSVSAAMSNVRRSFACYNHKRLHQALEYQTPAQVYSHTSR